MLFRAEALRHAAHDHTEGQVLLRSPAILWWCTLACAACASAIAILLWSAHYTPQIRLQGRMLTATSAQLLAPAEALDALRPGTAIIVHHGGAAPDRLSATVQTWLPALAGATRRTILLNVEQTASVRPHMAIEVDLALPQVPLRDWLWRQRRAQDQRK